MNRPCFQSHRRKAQHSSMFYCIQQPAISPTEKRNLGDLDKIFSSSNGFWTCLTPSLDPRYGTVMNMTLMLSLSRRAGIAKATSG